MTRVRTGWALLLAVGLGVLLGFPLTSPSYVRALTPTVTPTPSSQATRQVTDDEVNAIAKKLYCPVCENIPLDTCGTQACEDWRQLIRQLLEQGWTEEQILDYFVERYGERVLATPRPGAACPGVRATSRFCHRRGFLAFPNAVGLANGRTRRGHGSGGPYPPIPGRGRPLSQAAGGRAA